MSRDIQARLGLRKGSGHCMKREDGVPGCAREDRKLFTGNTVAAGRRDPEGLSGRVAVMWS